MQKQIISLFWQTAMKYPVRTIGAIVGSALTTIVASYLGPFVIAQLLERLQAGDVTLDSSIPLIIAYAAIQIYGQIVGMRLNLFFVWTMETAAQRDLYRRIFSKLSNQSLSFHADRFGGALVSQTTKLIGSFERFWDSIIFQIVPTIVGISTALIILSFVFWQYAVFLLLVSIVFAGVVFAGSKFLLRLNKEEAQASTATNAQVADSVTNIMTIKSHGNESDELERLTDRATTWRNKSLANMRGFLGVSTGYSSIIAVLNIVALVAAIWASEHAVLSIGSVYLAITYTFTVARQLWEMNNIMRNYNRIMGDAHDMTEILRAEEIVKDAPDAQPLQATKGAISFKGVQFAHDGDDPLFTNFNLAITPGQHVGLVGRSGSGKTSLTKLLLRFADVHAGSITIDTQSIADVTQESLRKSIAYVPQEPMLFHRSLRENIAYGNPDATEEQILTAAAQANATEFIEKLPQGLDTLVGERGTKLSGGQRQRVAIARAILKDAPILVLDEATSALDSESERLIQDALETLMEGRTSIVVAHRLSTIAALDRVVVLEDGAILEDGSHQELLSQKGQYAKLWSHQSGGFIES